MSQVSRRKMKPEVESRSLEVFADVLTSTVLAGSKSSFIELFMTPTEKIMFSKRVAIAILIKRGYSYDLIKEYVKVSQGTIANIAKQLAISPKANHRVLEQLIHNRNIHRTLTDFEYNLRTIIPPKGRDWSIWRKNLEHDKRLIETPF